MNVMKSDWKDSEMCAVNRLYVDVRNRFQCYRVLKYNATLSSVVEHHAPLKVVNYYGFKTYCPIV